jgi:hypothetical protein
MAENKSGTGASSPFGDGKGAPTGARASGSVDLVTNPTGGSPKTGGRDFIKDPASSMGGKGRDLVSEQPLKQKTGEDVTLCKDSIPAGGKVLMADPSAAMKKDATLAGNGGRSPFKLKG